MKADVEMAKRALKSQVTLSGWHVLFFVAAFAVVGTTALWQAFAAPNKTPSGKCTYSNQIVSAAGLPTNEVINFFMTDITTGSRTGWVLGSTSNGTWQVNVGTPKATTTYDFTSKTWGKSGSKFQIFAECSAVI